MANEGVELADRLAAAGYPVTTRWRSALEAVPRHMFIPKVAWVAPYGRPGYRIDRDEDPDHWMKAAYRDAPIVTQINDGAVEAGSGIGDFTSSASAPGVVVDFLELLDPFEGDAILEIGTGTGWTAGLLSFLQGDDRVTTVEVDPEVAKQAAANLEAVGYAPHLVVGDAAVVRPDGGPFDRVHITCGVTTLPYAWVEQTRPGGLIVFPWMPEIEGGHKVKLTVTGEGTAVGRLAHGGAGYMMLRSQRSTGARSPGEDCRESVGLLDPRRVFRASYGADVALAATLPDVSGATSKAADGSLTTLLWQGDSAAQAVYTPGGARFRVRQSGPRDLWDEVETAFSRWVAWGSPDRERFGITVTPDGQFVWLDQPSRVISESPPTRGETSGMVDVDGGCALRSACERPGRASG